MYKNKFDSDLERRIQLIRIKGKKFINCIGQTKSESKIYYVELEKKKKYREKRFLA